MSWKGLMRSMEAANRRAVRANIAQAKRTQRASAAARSQLLKAQAQMAAAHAEARAQYEVKLFENYLEFIVSMHADAYSAWDWNFLARQPQPFPLHERERAAAYALQSYQPTLSERALGKESLVRSQLQQEVERARHEDAITHQQAVANWDWYFRIANAVLAGDLNAYAAVIDHLAPFDELEALGTTVRVRTEAPWYLEAFVVVRNEELVPSEEVKLTASGKVSTKAMAKGRYWELYQDHVCSAALRVGREIFALLPIKTALVHVGKGAVNTSTGHDEIATLCSVRFEREPFLALNFERIDASNAVSGFDHRMKFKKTTGFTPTEPLTPTNDISSL